MNDSYMDYIQATHDIFERLFAEAYRASNAKRRAKLLPYVSNIYRRWYYTSLIEDTQLTPANIVESVNRAFDRQPEATPVIRLRSENKFIGFNIDICDYSLENHPVTGDLRKLIDYCRPTIHLTEDNSLDDLQAAELSNHLSMWDPHYATFLLHIALNMRLIKEIPSIYANHMQVVKDCDELLAVPDEVLFDEIVETAIKMTAYSLNSLIMPPETVFGESFIRGLLKQPMSTEEIFQHAYSVLGITPEEMLSINLDEGYDGMEDFDEEDEIDTAFLSGTFLLGLELDHCFFTPFSYYLKLIRPMYPKPFDFENEIQFMLDSGVDEEELKSAFFAPCTLYTLTDLGLKYLKVRPTPQNYLNIPNRLPFQTLKEQFFGKKSVIDAMPARIRKVTPNERPLRPVYAFKIKSDIEPAHWMHLDMPADATLHRLYLETVTRFGLNCNNRYSFFHDETENPFAEYTSPVHKRRAKKNAEAALETLDFEHRRTLILAVYNQSDPIRSGFMGEPNRSTVRLTMELTDIKFLEQGKVFPNVTRMSKALREALRDE